MKSASKLIIATFGGFAALMGIEHGIGEILQGSVAPQELFILSWPNSAFFEILSGEPAMTVVPNLLVTGILAVLFSTMYLVSAVWFSDRKYGSLALILLTIPMLLFGAGMFPPVLGLLIGLYAAWVNARSEKRRENPSIAWQGFAALFPWAYAACLLAWLVMFPGVPLLHQFFGLESEALIFTVLGCMFLFLLMAGITGAAKDMRGEERITFAGFESGRSAAR